MTEPDLGRGDLRPCNSRRGEGASRGAPTGSRRIALYDTTLRDGCQAYGFNLSVEDKLRVARRLDELGFAYIEGGWPGSNPRDEQFFARARRLRWRTARLAAFGSTRRPGTGAQDDPNLRLLLDAATPVATIVGKASAAQVRTVLGVPLEENLAMIADSVAFLKAAGREVMFDAEHFFDGFGADSEYSLACLRAAEEVGADWLVLCDTNGGTLPAEIGAVCRRVVDSSSVRVGIHTHNDAECAVANALAAVEAGAQQVQGTINGYGERVGNANLCSVVPNLQLKLGYICLPESSLERLTELSRYVSEVGSAPHSLKLPYVGAEAFAHKAGLHVNAIVKGPQTYEHVAPGAVGNERRVLVSDLSGRSNVQHKLEEMGLTLSGEETLRLLREVKRREHDGMVFEDADASFELLVRRISGDHAPGFALLGYSVTARQRRRAVGSEATVKVRIGREEVMAAAEGVGPVHALDAALRRALLPAYPFLISVRLADYKVRVVDNESGTSARVRVWIQAANGTATWNTVGASPNIVSASADALIDSLEYALMLADRGRAEERKTG
jgi:2-isopropylmalate synthase